MKFSFIIFLHDWFIFVVYVVLLKGNHIYIRKPESCQSFAPLTLSWQESVHRCNVLRFLI